MELQIRQPASLAGRVSPTLVAAGAAAVAALAYGFSSGVSAGGQLASDRLVVAHCWNAVDRQDPHHGGRETLVDGCRRMERGFRRTYGSRP